MLLNNFITITIQQNKVLCDPKIRMDIKKKTYQIRIILGPGTNGHHHLSYIYLELAKIVSWESGFEFQKSIFWIS